jgi:predicted RNase H-like nuclease (RuvC/YqgF family)
LQIRCGRQKLPQRHFFWKRQERIMGISGIAGGGASQAVDPGEFFTDWAAKKIHARGDCVSISDEGREKAEEFAKAKSASSGTGAGASSALNQSAEEQSRDLEAKIKGLMDQLMNIMQSALPLPEKMQQAQPVQQQISQLQMQINELKAQQMQEKHNAA